MPERFATATLVAERIWEREWLRDFHARRFGERLWVCPSHERVEQADAVVVALDPGLAFGTGTHASTALCLEWLDAAAGAAYARRKAGRPRTLSITAAARECSRSQLSSSAPVPPMPSTTTPRRCWRHARMPSATKSSARLRLCAQAEQLPSDSDLLLANILAPVLIERAGEMAALLRRAGWLVLGGILTAQEEEVAAAFTKWFDISRFASRDGWVALAGTRT